MDIKYGKRYALNCLSLRMYTCFEIFDKLIKKGVQKEDAEKIVFELSKEGILDDKKYAEYYALDKSKLSFYGAQRIKTELIKKGIPKSIIEDAIKSEDIDFQDGIKEYTKIKFGEKLTVSYKEITRIKNHLARRGYSYSEISDCLEELEIKASRSEEY